MSSGRIVDNHPRLKIGVFDSGIGGLTVLREINRLLPHEDILYLGDTARVPYGTKSEATVARYTERNVQFLLARDVKMIVIACNTASAYALQAAVAVAGDVPVVGVVEGGVRAARRDGGDSLVGIIATEATIRSAVYREGIGEARVLEKACPLFVSLVEEGWVDNNVADAAIANYLADMKGRVSSLILGCTHYPLLKESIARFLGNDIRLIDSAEETALLVREKLETLHLAGDPNLRGVINFIVTDSPERSKVIGERMLNNEIDLGQPELVDL